MSRVFIAINLPDTVKQELAQAQKEIIDSFPEGAGIKVGKWVKKDNLHLTLLFIGEIRPEALPKLCETVKEAAANCAGFEMEFKKISYDHNRGPARNASHSDAGGVPRLIWAEIAQNKGLLYLNKALKDKLLDEKILKYLDQRPFKSHITLARIRQWVFKQIEPEEQPDIERALNIKFAVKSVEIMESKLKRAGAEYLIIESIKLL